MFVLQIVQQMNWIPESLTQASGIELEKLSVLGPFLGLSLFAEDNVSLIIIHQCRSYGNL